MKAAGDAIARERFTWRTFGVRSGPAEFVAEERIAWDGSGLLRRC
jgi:hypothetical protein